MMRHSWLFAQLVWILTKSVQWALSNRFITAIGRREVSKARSSNLCRQILWIKRLYMEVVNQLHVAPYLASIPERSSKFNTWFKTKQVIRLCKLCLSTHMSSPLDHLAPVILPWAKSLQVMSVRVKSYSQWKRIRVRCNRASMTLVHIILNLSKIKPRTQRMILRVAELYLKPQVSQLRNIKLHKASNKGSEWHPQVTLTIVSVRLPSWPRRKIY